MAPLGTLVWKTFDANLTWIMIFIRQKVEYFCFYTVYIAVFFLVTVGVFILAPNAVYWPTNFGVMEMEAGESLAARRKPGKHSGDVQRIPPNVYPCP